MTYTASLATLALVGGGLFSFSIGIVKVAPIQHLINLLGGIVLSPWFGVTQAFLSSLLRNLAGTGTLLAFPGSMFGALLVGVIYQWTGKLVLATIGELIGTGIVGASFSYLLAEYVLGLKMAFWVLLSRFFISGSVGILIGYPLLKLLRKRLPMLFD